MSRHPGLPAETCKSVKRCHDNILMSRHQDQQLNTARCLSGCHDMIMMSRHHKQATEIGEGSAQYQDIKNDQFTAALTSG